MRRAACVLLACVSVSCVDRRVIDVPVDDYAFEYGFVVVRDGGGATTRTSAPFGVRDGVVTFGALPAYHLEPTEESLLLVTFPEGAVRTAVTVFDASRASELELIPLLADLPFYESKDDFLSIALPAGTRAFQGDLGEPLSETELPDLALRAPIAPEQCERLDASGLVAFADQAGVIPMQPNTSEDDFLDVDLVDAQTALGLTSRRLDLFRAGERFVPVAVTASTSGNAFGEEALSTGDYLVGGYALDRADARAWFIGTLRTEGNTGVLYELAVDSSGLSIVGTATLAETALAAITLDGDRRPIVLAHGGRVWRYGEAGVFAPMPPIHPSADGLSVSIAYTGDADLPFVASTTGELHVLDARRPTPSWTSERIATELLPVFPQEHSFNATGLASSRTPTGELELWAAGTGSLLLRKVGDAPWEPFPITYPPRFAACTTAGEYPNLVTTFGFDGLRVEGEDLLLTVRKCTAALQVRRDGGCTALLRVGGVDPSFDLMDLQALDVLGDTIIVGGEAGLLYRGTLR